MLDSLTRGSNVTDEEAEAAIAMAHLQMVLRMQTSLLESLQATQEQLKNVRAIIKDRKHDDEHKYKSVKTYIALWDKTQDKLIENLQKEINALHGMQHLATINPLTATRH